MAPSSFNGKPKEKFTHSRKPDLQERLMVACDSAGGSHGLITRAVELSARINHYPWLEPHRLVALEPPIPPVRRAAAISWAIHIDAEPRKFAEHGGCQDHE
jgi:hypothetical protein